MLALLAPRRPDATIAALTSGEPQHSDESAEYAATHTNLEEVWAELAEAGAGVGAADAAVAGAVSDWRAKATELRVCEVLEKENGAVSQGFHGRSFNGPAMRMVFWGRERERDHGVTASMRLEAVHHCAD